MSATATPSNGQPPAAHAAACEGRVDTQDAASATPATEGVPIPPVTADVTPAVPLRPAERNARLAALRAKVAANTITLPEMQEAIRLLRDGRLSECFQPPKLKPPRAAKRRPKAGPLPGHLDLWAPAGDAAATEP